MAKISLFLSIYRKRVGNQTTETRDFVSLAAWSQSARAKSTIHLCGVYYNFNNNFFFQLVKK